MRKGFIQTTTFLFALIFGLTQFKANAQAQYYINKVLKVGNGLDGFPNILNTDHFGGGMARIGDLDGDGVADIAVGAYTDNISTGVTAGSLYILFMKSDGSVKSYYKNTTPSGALDFGVAVCNIGDLDGDGIPDLAVGSNLNSSSGGIKFSGDIYICFMTKTGKFKSAPVKIAGTSMANWSAAQSPGPQFGKRIGLIGDYNKDGYPDIIVSADQDKSSTFTVATGSVFIVCLNSSGGVVKSYKIDAKYGNFSGWLANGDDFGSSVTGIGDWDGDGYLDVAVGAANTTDNSVTKSGAYYILELDNPAGSSAGSVKSSGVIRYSASTTGLTSVLTSSNEFFGSSLCYLNNWNFPGYKVMAVGATNDNDFANGAGAVWLVFHDSASGNVKFVKKISGLNPAIKNSTFYISGGDGFGYSIANYANTDTSSSQVLLVGAPNDTDGNASAGTGEFYILNLRKFEIKADTFIVKGKSDSVCANAAAYVGVVIENNSNQKIYSMPVQINVSGAGTATLKEVINVNLAPGKKDTFYLSTAFPTTTSGVFNLKGFLKYPGDFNQANDTSTGVLTVLPALSVPKFANTDTVYKCQGDVIKADLLNSGATYTWYKNGAVMSGTTTEVYNITTTGTYTGIARLGSCSVGDTVTVIYRKSAKVSLGPDQVVCFNDSTVLDAGYPDAEHHWYKASDLSWTDSNQVIKVKDNYTDTYYGTVTYNKLCKYSDTINITFNHVIVNLGLDTVLCDGQKYVLNAANPGSTFTWYKDGVAQSVTDMTDTVTASGTYAVKVQNGNCFGYDTVVVKFLSMPSVSFTPKFDTLCKGETRILDAGNPTYRHDWFKDGVDLNLADTTTQYTVKTDGAYKVVISNPQRAKCNAQDMATYTYNILSTTLGQPQSVNLCQGKKMALTAKVTTTVGNTQYFKWYHDGNPETSTTNSDTIKSAGKYWVVVTVGKCVASDTIVATYTPITTPNFGHKDTLLCKGTSITLDAANPGATYRWQDPKLKIYTTQQITADTIGRYKITVTNGKCQADTFINIDYINIDVQLGPDTTLCFGRPITLNAKNNNYSATYQWFQDGNAISGATAQKYSPAQPGIYMVQVFQKYCADSGKRRVDFQPSPVTVNKDTTICADDTLVLDAGNPGDKFIWSYKGLRTQKITIRKELSPTAVRTYKAYITNGGCTDTSVWHVRFYDPVEVKLPKEVYMCDTLKDGVWLDAGAAATYDWEPTGDKTRFLKVTSAGKYTVKIANIGGCSAFDSTHVYECPPTDVLIPTSFSPDNDDLNDTFKIYNLNSTEYDLTIYNRWGEVVFESKDINKGWDGKMMGNPVPEGIYNWTLVYRLHTSTGTPPRKIISGTVVLIRH